MKWQPAFIVTGLSVALGVGWLAGRSVPSARYANQTPVVQLDAQAMQMLFRNGSGSAATAPAGQLHVKEPEELTETKTADVQYFPQAIAPPPLDEVVQAEQQRVWDESLAHLPPEAAHEIQSLKTRLGSVAAASLGIDQPQPSGAEPAILKLPADGSIKAVTPVSATVEGTSTLKSPSSIESPTATAAPIAPSEFDPPAEANRRVQVRNTKFVKTPGFRRTVLIPTVKADGVEWEERLQLSPGEIVATGNPFDIAIDGDGWFVVRRDEQTQSLTRCGFLAVDKQSRLCIKTGLGLLPLVPEIVLPPMSQRLLIDGAGTCRVWRAGHTEPQEVGKLQLGSCLNPSQLRCDDEGLFSVTAESGAVWMAPPSERGLGKLRHESLEWLK